MELMTLEEILSLRIIRVIGGNCIMGLKEKVGYIFKKYSKYKYASIKISLTYLAIGFLWILFSDNIAELIAQNKEMLRTISTFKGWFYVIVTSSLLYLFLARTLKKVEDTEIKLSNSFEELSATYEELIANEQSLREQYELLEENKEQIKNAKEDAEKANRAKSVFLANMSHELRTPLNGIIGPTELLLMMCYDEDQKEFLEMIKASASHLLELISDVLDISKIEAGNLKFEKTLFSLDNLLKEVYNTHMISARKKSVSFDLQNSSDIPNYVIGDEVRLKQVLNNLVSNAFKFTENGNVCVIVRKNHTIRSQVELEFEIKDTGIGIKKEDISKLFTRFTQLDYSYRKHLGGAGLGLSICKEIVEALGGDIWVKSLYGKGSSFYFKVKFELSVSQEEGYKDEFKEVDTPMVLRDTVKLLLVEDNETNQKYISHLIKSKGWLVDIAQNGEIALTKANLAQYNLILMDIQMPVLDGFTAAELIREKEKNEHKPATPIIAMTAYALKGDEEKCFKKGMNDYIAKPFDPNTFYRVMERWLDLNL